MTKLHCRSQKIGSLTYYFVSNLGVVAVSIFWLYFGQSDHVSHILIYIKIGRSNGLQWVPVAWEPANFLVHKLKNIVLP